MNRNLESSQPDDVPALRIRLEEADGTLRAIRSGEVDAVVGVDDAKSQIFNLGDTGDAYRQLIDSLDQGALMLSHDQIILYSNSCFAKMVNLPLEQVIGAPFHDFISVADQALLRRILKQAQKGGSRVNLFLKTSESSSSVVMVCICAPVEDSKSGVTCGVVINDISESRRKEELHRGFYRRLVQMHEAERECVASELHSHITQLLCAVLAHSEVLNEKLSKRNTSGRKDLEKLQKMVGKAATAVERISRHLRPSVLDHLGLSAMLQNDSVEFSARSGVPLELNCGQLTARLPPDVELAFYRILQEALKNVEIHAQAKHATVHLTQLDAFVELSVKDDGIGFDTMIPNLQSGFGLHSMRERATALGGSVRVISASGQGTTIQAQIPIYEKQKDSKFMA